MRGHLGEEVFHPSKGWLISYMISYSETYSLNIECFHPEMFSAPVLHFQTLESMMNLDSDPLEDLLNGDREVSSEVNDTKITAKEKEIT